MPATQHDALVWLSGSAYDVVFDMARSIIHDLAGQASLGEETSSWSYRHDRDLTGFIDGSENPTLLDAPAAALLPEGVPGAAGSVLLLQKWKHKPRTGKLCRSISRSASWDAPSRQYRTREQASRLACGAHGSGRVRAYFSSQHALRKSRRRWHHVRWLQRRPEAAFQNAR